MRHRHRSRLARIREEIHQGFQAEIAQIDDADADTIARELAQITWATHRGPAQKDFSDRWREVTRLQHDDLPQNEDLEPDHPRTDTVLAASTVFSRRPKIHLAQGRDVSRTVNSAVDASESLAVPGRDLRMMRHGDREETRAVIAELRELLSKCPAGAFGAEGAAMALATVATLAEILIADRDERAALRLIRTASPHLVSLGRRHPAVFRVRRAWAEALSELGWYPQAERLLRRLSEDEQRVFGSADPQTALLLLWALVGSGRLREAEEGFRALDARLAQLQGASTPMLWHLQCRYSWLLGQQGRVNESAKGYNAVILNRSHKLSDAHADALDARHSKGKMLVIAGEGAHAVTLLEVLAEDRARVQGDRHPDTLETLKYLYLAHVQAEPHDGHVLDDAINNLEQILHTQEERHGPGYPLSRDTFAWLRKLRHLQEAIRFHEQIPDLGQVPIVDERTEPNPVVVHGGASRNAQAAPREMMR